MSFPDLTKLAESLRRGKLTPEEEVQIQACLAAHPEQQALWDEEVGLNYALRHLPDAPVSSNFTARVLAHVRADELTGKRMRLPIWRRAFGGWTPKLAFALAMISLGLLSYEHHQATVRREMVQNVAEFSKLTSGGALEFLQNFDAIARLGQVPGEADRQLAGDRELIAALQ